MAGLLFWVALLGVVQGTVHGDAGVMGASDETQPSQKCWVFNHMNKSGGKTVKHMLVTYVETNPSAIGELYDASQWISGSTVADDFLRSNATITMGGYTEGLRPRGDRGCTWFTVFRHPVSRLVSAYFYCQMKPGDQLCGSRIVDAKGVDLLTFAKHWGNYGLRQFLLAFVLPEDVVASKLGSDVHVCGDDSATGLSRNACPAWYRLKRFVERQSTCNHEEGGPECESGPESWMLQFLKPIEDILNTKYTAVGLLEEWETTLLLFDATLGIPDYDWPAAFERNGRINAYSAPKSIDALSHENLKIETLRKAWVDPELKEILWLDILLYDHAVRLFKQQADEQGLL